MITAFLRNDPAHQEAVELGPAVRKVVREALRKIYLKQTDES
jgi:hypothetical protein